MVSAGRWVAGHVDLELFESLEQVGFEVGDPGTVLRGVLDVDAEQEQPIVVPHAVLGPAALRIRFVPIGSSRPEGDQDERCRQLAWWASSVAVGVLTGDAVDERPE